MDIIIQQIKDISIREWIEGFGLAIGFIGVTILALLVI